MSTTKKKEIYSDFRANFDVHPVKQDLVRLVNEDAVARSIRNILLTNVYERRRNPGFGAGLAAYLFENISKTTESNIKKAIEDAITNYEPRASLVHVHVSALPDKNAYTATIVFSVVNRLEPIQLDLLLERIR